MSNIFLAIAPVFALILLGYLAARSGLLAEATTRGLSDFIFVAAMPALLFRTMVVAAPLDVAPLGLLGSFFGPAAVIWIATTVLMSLVLKRPRRQVTGLAMAATFGNTVMVGLPVGVSLLGHQVLPVLALIVAVHAPILWVAATVQIESLGDADGNPGDPGLMRRIASLAVDLARNPIVAGVIAGSLWRLTGLGLHPVPDRVLELLGAAGVPGALFALGMSLVRFHLRDDVGAVATLVGLKLIAFPVLVFAACWLFALPPLPTAAVLLLACCPSGANAYIFAERYDSGTTIVSGAVAVGTALSIVTMTVVLSLAMPALN